MAFTGIETDYSFKYIIIEEDAIKPYYEDGLSGDWLLFCRSEYTLMGLVCVKISSPLLETIRPSLGRSFEEVSAIEAIQGIQFFRCKSVIIIIWIQKLLDIIIYIIESDIHYSED